MATDDELVQWVREHPDPVVGTSEVAAAFDYVRQSADKRLRALEAEGRIHSKKIGGVRVWWPADGD